MTNPLTHIVGGRAGNSRNSCLRESPKASMILTLSANLKPLETSQSGWTSARAGPTSTTPGYIPTSPIYIPTSPGYSPTSPIYSPIRPEIGATSPVYDPDSPQDSCANPAFNPANSEAPTATRSSRTNQPPRVSTGGWAPRKQLASKAAPSTKRSMFIDVEAEVDDDDDEQVHEVRLPKRNMFVDVNDRCHRELDFQGQAIQSNSESLPKRRKEMKKSKISANVEFAENAKEEAEESDEDMGFALFDDDLAVSAAPAAEMSMKRTTSKSRGNNTPAKEQGTVLERLIQFQSFEGSWTRDNLPCDAMGISRDAARTSVKKLTAETGIDEDKIATMLATAIVVLFLEKKLSSEEETWELIVEKARDWLDDAVTSEVLAQVWKEAGDVIGK